MGTWSLPHSTETKLNLIEAVQELERLKDKLYPVFGDDQLFDCLDLALKIMREQIGKATLKGY